MIELSCQTCGEKVGVQSFLTAAQQPCLRCGQLLMGPLGHGRRVVRPVAVKDPAAPRPVQASAGSSTRLWVGVGLGAIAGLALAGAVAVLDPAIPLSARNAVLGALSGVLLAPVIAIVSFVYMLISPVSLFGIIGDSSWSRVLTALFQRRFGPLVVPLLVFLVLPMTLCAVGGAKMKASDPPLLASAALGAVLLGAVIGGICGAFAGRRG